MEDTKRQILTQVVEGKLTPEEADRKLGELEAASSPSPGVEPAPSSAPAATPGVRTVRVNRVAGSVDVQGDPSVLEAVAEGEHVASHQGDTLIIEGGHGEVGFAFGNRGLQMPGIDRRLVVRMNPDLALDASLQAGTLRVYGLKGAIKANVQAGSARLDGFQGPLDINVQAGSLRGTGVLAGGESRIRSEAGSVKLHLERGSSVTIDVDSTMGSSNLLEAGGDHATVGGGAGRLRIDSTMGSVKVTADE